MFKVMVSGLLLVTGVAAPLRPAYANLNDYQDVYVGRIWVEKGTGALRGVVLLDHPSNSSGSYWILFQSAQWTVEEQKAALTTLMAAKLSGHRVSATTTNIDGCGIVAGQTDAKAVFLSNSP
jgi:hypothetical protein